jgi:type II secretory pathway component PulJ
MNSRGITLIELLLAVSLTTVVLFSAYYFLIVSSGTLTKAEAEFDAGQDARMAVIRMEEDLRKAQAVTISGTNHKAVEVFNAGMEINIYSFNDDTSIQMVKYRLVDDKLERGTANLSCMPVIWEWITLAKRVKNDMIATPVPVFTISGKMVKIHLQVLDEMDELYDNPISVKTSITVRGKGAMN